MITKKINTTKLNSSTKEEFAKTTKNMVKIIKESYQEINKKCILDDYLKDELEK